MFITFDNPNYIYTEDPALMDYSKRWYDKIRKNSYSLGSGSGHLRFEYFNSLKSRLEESKKNNK